MPHVSLEVSLQIKQSKNASQRKAGTKTTTAVVVEVQREMNVQQKTDRNEMTAVVVEMVVVVVETTIVAVAVAAETWIVVVEVETWMIDVTTVAERHSTGCQEEEAAEIWTKEEVREKVDAVDEDRVIVSREAGLEEERGEEGAVLLHLKDAVLATILKRSRTLYQPVAVGEEEDRTSETTNADVWTKVMMIHTTTMTRDMTIHTAKTTGEEAIVVVAEGEVEHRFMEVSEVVVEEDSLPKRTALRRTRRAGMLKPAIRAILLLSFKPVLEPEVTEEEAAAEDVGVVSTELKLRTYLRPRHGYERRMATMVETILATPVKSNRSSCSVACNVHRFKRGRRLHADMKDPQKEK